MSLRDQPAQNLHLEEKNEVIVIDWFKVLQFLLGYYRYLLIGAFGGALLALAISVGFRSYDIRLVVPNIFNTDITNYRELVIAWAERARELAKQDSLPPADRANYERLSNQLGNDRHITPIYSILKSDLKNGMGTVDPKSQLILGLQLSISAQGIDEGIKELLLFRQFLYSARTYILTRKLLINYETENLLSLSEIGKEVNKTEIALFTAKRQLVHLEDLQKRYPSSTIVANQILDLTESGAKYLPIATQLIAVRNDVFTLNEFLAQLHEKTRQTKLMGQFLSEAKPIMDQEQDGLKLITRLLEVVANLRKALSPNDLYLSGTLNGIQSELLTIQTQFLLSLNDPNQPTTIITTLRIAKSVALSFFGGGLLALLICLGLYFWPSAKRAMAKTEQMD
jgi:hypothetical protein